MTTTSSARRRRPRRWVGSMPLLCGLLLVAMLGQDYLLSVFDVPALRTGSTVFVAVVVQAPPFWCWACW